MSKNQKKKKNKATFKNTYPFILIGYIVVIIISYCYAIFNGFGEGWYSFRAISRQIIIYFSLPTILFIFTNFDNNISDTKNHKTTLIITHILFFILGFYPTLLAIIAIFA